MSLRYLQVSLCGAFAALTCATPARAQTCTVPASHPTIALALADSGCTTIQVAAGTYVENLVVGRNVTIEGAGQASTIIDGGANGRVIDIGPALTVQIRDLTARNGRLTWDNGAGIRNGSLTSPQPGQGSNLTLTRVTVTGNNAGDGFGGGIENNRHSTLLVEFSKISANRARDGGGIGVVIDSTATINDSVIGGDTQADGNIAGTNNYRGFGGGINNTDGTVHVNRSVVRNNRTYGSYGPGPGGGICNDTTNGFSVLTIADSTIADNYGAEGGGIAGDGFRGSITITSSTLSGNTSDDYFANGGAIWLYNGHALTISNSTVSGNVARGVSSAIGAGIGTVALYNSTYDSYATLTNVTITDNLAWAVGNSYVTNPSAGSAGIGRQSGVKFRILNTIVSGNQAKAGSGTPFNADCGGAELDSLGHNLFGQDGSTNGCPTGNGTDVIPPAGTMTSAVIGPLADNGGPTYTHMPVTGGLAIDGGDDSVALTTDQIGGARQFGAHVDIGAVEAITNTAPSADAGGPYSVVEGGSATLTGSGSDPDQDSSSLDYAWDLDNDGSYETTGQSVAFSAAGLDGPSTATVGLRVCDAMGACATATTTVAIQNVAPVASVSGPATAIANQSYALSGTYSDAGPADTHTATINWGDGNTETIAIAGGTFSASHQYSVAGPYTVSACVTDDDGASACASLNVTVASSAGKVTGGGLRTANDGRGGFNVMSNGTAVTGELQFQSALGKFHASWFTTLAVAPDGRSAWFAGVGRDGRAFTAYVEDNGEPGRNDVFRLWIDGVLQNGDGAMSGGNVQILR